MRRLLVLCGAILCLAIAVPAQDSPAALDTGSSEDATAALPAALHPSHRDDWQLGAGYQYQHYDIFGLTFHTNGVNTDLTRYLNDYLGIEGTVAGGFGGNTGAPYNLDVKTLFIGGGPHVAVQNASRFEPWFHALVGWEHLRVTQTSFHNLGSNSSFGLMVGGGVDIKVGGRAYWRVQGDYLGSRFQSQMQTNYSIGSGIVVNF